MRYIFIALLIATVFSCSKKTNSSKEPPLPVKVDSLFQAVYVDSLTFEARYDAIHEIETFFESRANDSTTRRNYFKIANRYQYLNDFNGFYNAAQKAYRLGIASKDTLTIARGYYYFGEYYLQFKKLDSAFYNYKKSESLYEITNDIERHAIVLRRISIIYKDIKNYSNSEKYIVLSIEKLKELNDPYSLYAAYNSLGALMTETKKYDKGYEYYHLALKNLAFADDMAAYQLQLKAQTLINMGVLFEKQKRFNEALLYFNKALEIEELEYQYPLNYSYLLQNLAYTKHKLGEKNVMPLFNKALRIQDSMGYGYAKAATQNKIAQYFLELNKRDSSFYYAQNAYRQAQQDKVINNELKALHLLAKTDKQNSALWYETYISLQDSISNYERAQQEKFALIAFDTENLKSQKQLAETRVGRLVNQLWFIAGVSILLLSFGFLLFKYRTKRLKNRELLLKQEELQNKEQIYAAMLEEQFKIEEGKHLEKKRISRELHDGVLGKLSGIRLNLFVLNKKKDHETIEKCLPYIKDLQLVEKEIRAISHNLSEDLFSDQVSFTKMIVNLFEKIEGHTNLKFKIHIDELIDWKVISTSIKIEVYRIVQESLHNIEKHAKATQVTVKMQQSEDYIIIEIIDNGIGMRPELKTKGIGVKNMKERSAKINAKLSIDSQKDKGTTISLLLPKKVVFEKQK